MRKWIYIFLLLALSFLLLIGLCSASPDLDSLRSVYNDPAQPDTNRLQANYEIAWSYIYTQPDSAFLVAQEGLNLAEQLFLNNEDGKIERLKWKAQSLNTMGVSYYIRSDYPKALEYYIKSLSLLENMAEQAQIKGNSKLYNRAKKALPASYNNIGVLYWNMDDLKTAQEYYFKSMKLKEELGDKKGMAASYSNIGIIYKIQGNYDKALDYYLKSVQIKEELGDDIGLAGSYNNIANLYHKQNDYSMALNYYLKSLKIAELLGDKEGMATYYCNLGKFYFARGKLQKALDHCLKGIEISKEIGSLYHEKENCECVSKAYEKMVDHKNAFAYYKQFSMLKDSLFNEEKSKEIGKLEAKYEMEKELAEEKRVAEEQKRIEAEKEARSNNLQYSGILIFIVLLFVGVFMLGRVAIPVRFAEGIIFFTFLLFFEFTLVLLDPYIEQFSAGAPAIKLGFNAIIAGLIFPLHSFFEERLKKRIISARSEKS
ncbi:MAG: tetratricopeptide repeat protein [Bacteroidota bacterium]